MAQNQLSQQTSPYLLQHQDNPVHWYAWGDEAFEEAAKQDKPILLSIGYAACHWCHVMAHESFEDPQTADVMNEHYINIKVDREEHPDVDALYQKALSIIGQQGGWPLTMFLTPSGQPFWGGTYFPKQGAYGRPAFVDVLHTISNIFHHKKDDVLNNVDAIKKALDEDSLPNGDGSLTLDRIKQAVTYIHQNIDSTYGGLRGAPKFPQPVLFDFLWRASWCQQDTHLQELTLLTLEKMCRGGIYDHLGGGFARYSTDEEWLAPHFEKMLYDNGLLISLLTMVWRKHPLTLFKRSVEESIDWALREMTIGDANDFAFAAALDADSEGEEGKFYVWQEEEIDQLLGNGSASFKQAFDVTSGGNWEGKNILRRVTEFSTQAEEDKLREQRTLLLKERAKRIRPQRDDKILMDWNAMMIKALCDAGLVFERADWIETAKQVYQHLLHLCLKGDVLHHSFCNGQLGAPAFLEDYANLCLASLALYEVTGETAYFDQSQNWADHIEQAFWDKEQGGYTQSSTQTVHGVETRPKPVHDNATPSGNGLMAHVLCELYHLSGDEKYKTRFEKLIQTFGNGHPNEIFSKPALCSAVINFEKMETIAILGDPQNSDKKSLISMTSNYPSPFRKILLGDNSPLLHAPQALQGKSLKEGKPTAYVCQLGSCTPPVNSAEELKDILNHLPL